MNLDRLKSAENSTIAFFGRTALSTLTSGLLIAIVVLVFHAFFLPYSNEGMSSLANIGNLLLCVHLLWPTGIALLVVPVWFLVLNGFNAALSSP